VRNSIREGTVAAIAKSVTVAVARQKQIIWKRGGWVNSEKRIAATWP
jgi:hypothetical protein